MKSGRGVTLTPHLLLVALVMKELTYTSTPTTGRTACTEPQCLYKGDLYLYHLSIKWQHCLRECGSNVIRTLPLLFNVNPGGR